MKTFKEITIKQLDKLYRINLMNSISGYKSANLVGSRSLKGEENVAVFSSVVHLGSNPPLLGFVLRPTTVPRHTYENIKETGVYTVNHICESILEDAHHTSAKYPKTVSEFEVTALEPEYKSNCNAPFVKQSPVKMEMEYVEEYYIKANDTIMIVGAIKTLYVEDDLLENDGFVNLSKGNVAAINGLDGYTIPSLKTRFDYQRPKKEINV